jgi:uncharacterized delta-60 repeat protein
MYRIFTTVFFGLCFQFQMSAQIFTATMDDTWNPADDGQQALGSTGVANAPTATNFVLPLPNGQLILASGDSYNQTRVFGLVRTNANGQLDATFGIPNNLSSRIFTTLALQPDGKILAGGRVEFNFSAGLTPNNLHRYNPDGTYDNSFTQGTHDNDGTIKKILVLPNGNILVAGSFTSFNGVTTGRLVRLLPNGTVDATYAIGTGANSTIESMLLLPDGKIMIVGAFTSFNGIAVNRMARLNTDGSIDALFTGSANNTVFSIAAMPGNDLLVTGNFTSISSQGRNRVAVLSQVGNVQSTFGDGLTLANGIVYSALPLQDGSIMVAGQFTTFNNVARNSHVRVNASGNIVAGYTAEPNGTISGTITGLTLQEGDKIILNGTFQFLQRVNYGGITRINTSGFIDPTFNPNGGAGSFLNRYVASMQRMADGRIMIGGFFSKYNGIPCFNIMRLLPDGLPDLTFEPGDEGPVGSIRTLAVQPDNKTIIAGGFSRVDGVTVPGFARLLENGRLDPSFTPQVMNAFASTDVRVIQLLSDGKMYIGGDFQKIGSNTNLKYIARLMPDGLPDPGFTPPVFSGAFGRVNAISIMDDGKVLVGGSNLILPGETDGRALLRLNADGSNDASFNGGNPGFASNENPTVFGLLKTSNNQLIIWGNFFNYNAQGRRYLVRLNVDGTLVTPNPYASLPANFIIPDQVIEQPNGKLLVTGTINYFVGNIGYSGLLRLNSNGSIDNNFRVGTGFRALNGAGFDALFANMVDDAILVENKLLVCGGFTDFNGVARNRVARINLGDVITPVTWQYFTATKANGNSLLQWQTSSEQDNKGFEVQRSADGQNFNTLDFVPAAGNGTSILPNQYNYSDLKPMTGNNYYRLLQTDLDGTISFSKIVMLNFGTVESVNIYPNPLPRQFIVNIGGSGTYQIGVADMQGKPVQTFKITIQQGENSATLSRGEMTAGMYFITIKDLKGNIVGRQKVIVQ